MTEDTENLVLEILKKIQADIGDILRGQWDLRERVSSLEQQSALMRQDLARLDHRLDGMEKRLERIERRLELSDETP